MNLLSLILVAMAIIVAGCVFYAAWQFSSGEFESRQASAIADSPDVSNDSVAQIETDESTDPIERT